MIYRKYGKTNKKISILGLGGSRFRIDAGERNFDRSLKLVRKAFESGINFFDTSPHYCHGRSEEIFGEALSGIKGKYYISTKSRVIEDPDADSVRRRIESSLKRLKKEKIDFYDMWAVSSMAEFRMIMKKKGPYEGALKAKDEGLVDHITFSSRLPDKEIIEMIKSGYFDGVTLSYNIMNYPSSENAVKEAARAGMGVAIMNPLSGGIIPGHPERFTFLQGKNSESIAQAALHFVMATPGVTTAICGTGSLVNLERNIAAGGNRGILSAGKLKDLKNKIDHGLFDMCNSCNRCLASCSRGIHIPLHMDIYNLKIMKEEDEVVGKYLSDKKKHALYSSYKPGTNCNGCRECEKKCPKKLNIYDRLRYLNEYITTDK